MAVYENVTTITMIAGEDLRNGKCLLLYVEDDGGEGKVVKTTSLTQVPIGILAENPIANIDTDGINVPVTLLSAVVKVVAGGTITAGQLIVADTVTAGRVTGVTGLTGVAAEGTAIGVALESAVDGDFFRVLSQVMN